VSADIRLGQLEPRIGQHSNQQVSQLRGFLFTKFFERYIIFLARQNRESRSLN